MKQSHINDNSSILILWSVAEELLQSTPMVREDSHTSWKTSKTNRQCDGKSKMLWQIISPSSASLYPADDLGLLINSEVKNNYKVVFLNIYRIFFLAKFQSP